MGRGNPVASPRMKGAGEVGGVPRRDISSRVYVRVASISAGGAPEGGLALARLRIHLPACRAALTRIVRPYLLHSPWRFLFQAAGQQTPPGPQDNPVETSFLTDVAAGALRCSFRGSGHVLDLEVFDLDDVEAPRDISRSLFGPVFKPVLLANAQSGDSQLHPRTAFRPAPGPSQFPFQPPHPLAFMGGQAGGIHPTFGTHTWPIRRDRRRTWPCLTDTTRNPSFRPALRHDGRPAGLRGSKNATIAWAKSRKACCCTICEPAASHGYSARAAVSCRDCSRYPGALVRPECQCEYCSTARFHTYRAWAQWLRSVTSWAGVGSKRY